MGRDEHQGLGGHIPPSTAKKIHHILCEIPQTLGEDKEQQKDQQSPEIAQKTTWAGLEPALPKEQDF
jgi:hypothetical protein